MPGMGQKSAELLERLIQDERNASVYYKYLSENAPSAGYQETLTGVAKDCEERCLGYQQILQSLYARSFEPKETPVTTTVGFDRGIEIAVSEERKILESMAELLDEIEEIEEIEHLKGRASARAMQNLINKRMIRLSWLQWTMYQMRSQPVSGSETI